MANEKEFERSLRGTTRRTINYTLTGVHMSSIAMRASRDGLTLGHVGKIVLNVIFHSIHEVLEHYDLEDAANAIVALHAAFNIVSLIHELYQLGKDASKLEVAIASQLHPVLATPMR